MSWVETQVSVSEASGLPHEATCLPLSMEMDAGGHRKKKWWLAWSWPLTLPPQDPICGITDSLNGRGGYRWGN